MRSFETPPTQMNLAASAKGLEKVQKAQSTSAWNAQTPSAPSSFQISPNKEEKKFFTPWFSARSNLAKKIPRASLSQVVKFYTLGMSVHQTGTLNLVILIVNSVLSRRNARFVYFDLKIFASKPQWSDPNMCASSSWVSHKNSSRNTTLHKHPKTAGSILRSSAVAMSYRNQDDLPMTSCAPVLRRRDITKPP